MEPRDLFALLSCILLVISGLFYGAAFIRRKNYLLGLEFLIVGISASNFTTFIATGWQANYNIAIFLDAFSRGWGASYRYARANGSYPRLQTVARQGHPHFCSWLCRYRRLFPVWNHRGIPPLFLCIHVVSLYLVSCYFTLQLACAGEALHTLATIAGGLAGLVVALRYDFFPIPGDDTKMVFMTMAFLAWSYSMVQLYYAYGALERSNKVYGQAFPRPR